MMEIIVEDYSNRKNDWYYIKGFDWYYNYKTGYACKIVKNEDNDNDR